MQYTINKGEKGKVEIKVDIGHVDFTKVYETTLDTLGRDVNIDGFRPGTAPRDVLEAKVGASKVLNEAAGFLISQHLADIFKKEEIFPLGNPSIAVHTLAKASPFSFTATITTKPKIKIGDWKAIKAKRIEAKKVTEQDVEASITNIYEAWKKQKGTADKEQLTSDSNDEERGQDGKKFIYDAQGNKRYIKEEDKKGEQKSDEPGIHDDFAKAIGARDIAHLREIVTKDLEQLVADQVEAKLEEEVFDELLKISTVEVPDILVDDEVNRMVVRLNQTLEQQRRKLEDYVKEQNTTVDALRAKWRAQAEKNVKVTLAMDSIGTAEKVQVTPEEVEQAMRGMDQTKLTTQQKADLEQYLHVSIFQAKTLDLVKKAVAAEKSP